MESHQVAHQEARELAQQATRQQVDLKRPDDTGSTTKGPLLLTITEAAGALRVSRWMVYRLIHTRQLHTVKIGRRRFVPAQALESFVDQISHVEEA